MVGGWQGPCLRHQRDGQPRAGTEDEQRAGQRRHGRRETGGTLGGQPSPSFDGFAPPRRPSRPLASVRRRPAKGRDSRGGGYFAHVRGVCSQGRGKPSAGRRRQGRPKRVPTRTGSTRRTTRAPARKAGRRRQSEKSARRAEDAQSAKPRRARPAGRGGCEARPPQSPRLRGGAQQKCLSPHWEWGDGQSSTTKRQVVRRCNALALGEEHGGGESPPPEHKSKVSQQADRTRETENLASDRGRPRGET